VRSNPDFEGDAGKGASHNSRNGVSTSLNIVKVGLEEPMIVGTLWSHEESLKDILGWADRRNS
jgi:hypothetical protein